MFHPPAQKYISYVLVAVNWSTRGRFAWPGHQLTDSITQQIHTSGRFCIDLQQKCRNIEVLLLRGKELEGRQQAGQLHLFLNSLLSPSDRQSKQLSVHQADHALYTSPAKLLKLNIKSNFVHLILLFEGFVSPM